MPSVRSLFGFLEAFFNSDKPMIEANNLLFDVVRFRVAAIEAAFQGVELLVNFGELLVNLGNCLSKA